MYLELYAPGKKMTPADVVKCKNLRTLEIVSKHVKFEKSRTSIASRQHILILHFKEYPLSNLKSVWYLHFWILKAFKT